MAYARLTKVKTLFVLITKGGGGSSNHFGEQTCRHKRESNTKDCHHTAEFSRADTTSNHLRDSTDLPGNAYNPISVADVEAP